jgi:exodeoxyribonuclease VII large subunit
LIHRYQSILEQTVQKQLIQQRHRYASLIELLDAYSPLSVLKRGYAITMKENHVMKSVDEINIDDQIQIKMNDGIIYANVTNKEKNDGTKQDLSTIITSPRNHCK